MNFIEKLFCIDRRDDALSCIKRIGGNVPDGCIVSFPSERRYEITMPDGSFSFGYFTRFYQSLWDLSEDNLVSIHKSTITNNSGVFEFDYNGGAYSKVRYRVVFLGS